MNLQLERALLVVTPLVATATVALGLRVGGPTAVRAAVVYGAPSSGAGLGLAWQIVAFDEEHGVRQPVELRTLEVLARQGQCQARWEGATSEDGAAEVLLPLRAVGDGMAGRRADSACTGPLRLEVRARENLLALGEAAMNDSPPPTLPSSSWARFSRREGSVVMDVAVAGQRVATGFPSSLWVRATDGATHTPLAGVVIEPEGDTSFVPAEVRATTDARGWARIVATPVGHAVGVVLHAKTEGGRTGDWAGGMYVSPGAAQLALSERVSPQDGPVVDVVVPTLRTTAYFEVDDAHGRVWATAAPVHGPEGAMPSASVHVPRLPPGLYWAVEAGDPSGAAELGPGTIAKPFFVADTDEAALAFGTDREACAPASTARETARVVSVCLALAAAVPVTRWIALDGLAMQHARDAEKRATGLAVALGGILLAVLLEATLLLRTAIAARAQLRSAASEDGPTGAKLVGRAWGVGIAILVAMSGFALLAAFLSRLG